MQGTARGHLPDVHDWNDTFNNNYNGYYYGKITSDGSMRPVSSAEYHHYLEQWVRMLMRTNNEGQQVVKMVPLYMTFPMYCHYKYWGARKLTGIETQKRKRGGQSIFLAHITPVNFKKLGVECGELFFWGYQ